MITAKGSIPAVIAVTTIGAFIVAGCSASASFSVGSTPKVSKDSVQTEVATELAKQANLPTPKVACPGDLAAKVGTVMYCTLTTQGSSTPYPVQVTVDSVNGNDVHFNILLSKTPSTFTTPS